MKYLLYLYIGVFLMLFASCKSSSSSQKNSSIEDYDLSVASNLFDVSLLNENDSSQLYKLMGMSDGYERNVFLDILTNGAEMDLSVVPEYTLNDNEIKNIVHREIGIRSFVGGLESKLIDATYIYKILKVIDSLESNNIKDFEARFEDLMQFESKISKIVDPVFTANHHLKRIPDLCRLMKYHISRSEEASITVLESASWEKFMRVNWSDGCSRYFISRLVLMINNNSEDLSVHDDVNDAMHFIGQKLLSGKLNKLPEIDFYDLHCFKNSQNETVRAFGYEGWIFIKSWLKKQIANQHLMAAIDSESSRSSIRMDEAVDLKIHFSDSSTNDDLDIYVDISKTRYKDFIRPNKAKRSGYEIRIE